MLSQAKIDYEALPIHKEFIISNGHELTTPIYLLLRPITMMKLFLLICLN